MPSATNDAKLVVSMLNSSAEDMGFGIVVNDGVARLAGGRSGVEIHQVFAIGRQLRVPDERRWCCPFAAGSQLAGCKSPA